MTDHMPTDPSHNMPNDGQKPERVNINDATDISPSDFRQIGVALYTISAQLDYLIDINEPDKYKKPIVIRRPRKELE